VVEGSDTDYFAWAVDREVHRFDLWEPA